MGKKSKLEKKQTKEFKTLMSTKLKGDRIVANYQDEVAAKRKVAQLRKQGYRARYECIMGNYEVWVSAKYFKDHPRVKGYIG